MDKVQHRPGNLFFISGCLLVTLHFLLFDQLFPNSRGALGHDYALFLPALLDGDFWVHLNGIFQTPWFTPAFCGGLPKFANPNAGFYSVPQFLSFSVSPITSIKLTLIIFSGLGYSGFYILLRRLFGCNRYAALLGACLFLFNGFYIYRMAIGHLSYHSFMLIPWITYFALTPLDTSKPLGKLKYLCGIVLASLMLAYMVYSGMVNVILPCLLIIALLGVMHALVHQGRWPITFTVNLSLIGVIALCIAASQLVASYSYLNQFPRDFYKLPGIPSLSSLIQIIIQGLFFSPPDELSQSLRTNVQFGLGQHEYEFMLGLVPLVIGLIWLLSGGKTTLLKRVTQTPVQKLLMVFLGLGLCIPIALNFYTPEWNKLLKSLPVIGNSSTLVRWYAVYIPPVIVATCLICMHNPLIQRYQRGLTWSFVAYIIADNVMGDLSFYHKQDFKPQYIEEKHQALHQGGYTPAIYRVGANNLTQRTSDINCYEPIFGYGKEDFPKKTLHEGPVIKARNGLLNIKNPACYMFPEENDCLPGDHFRADQIPQARRFINYLPFDFVMSTSQKLANLLTQLSLILTLGLFTYTFWKMIRRRKQPHTPALLLDQHSNADV